MKLEGHQAYRQFVWVAWTSLHLSVQYALQLTPVKYVRNDLLSACGVPACMGALLDYQFPHSN